MAHIISDPVYRSSNYSRQRYRSVHIPLLHYPEDETAIFDYRPTRSQSYTRPEQIGRVSSRFSEDTMIIGEAYHHWRRRNYSHSYNQPTYEENLELQERMGRVVVGLSEETIMRHLKIRSYDVTDKRMEEEGDICVICQGEYKKDELVGGLQCRHEYHVDCVKKWLHQHNSCPICKAAAVSSNGSS